jgi:ankyrin repeat protein
VWTEILLSAGANVRASDEAGVTPLELAQRHNAPDLVALFERAQRGKAR